jgi:subtilisin family serine protease
VVIRLAYNESVKAKCDVINMSYGYYGIAADEGEQKALQLVSDAGVIPVAAAGNEGGNRGEAYLWTVGSPALMTNVISVAALNNSKIPVTTFTVNRNITSGTDAPSDVLCESAEVACG